VLHGDLQDNLLGFLKLFPKPLETLTFHRI
jgi:hypothetical protein